MISATVDKRYMIFIKDTDVDAVLDYEYYRDIINMYIVALNSERMFEGLEPIYEK